MTFKKIYNETFAEIMKGTDLGYTIQIIQSNLEGGNYFWQEGKTHCYKDSPSSADYKIFYQIGQLFSFQETFFGTMVKPAFIQDNKRKRTLAIATAYRYVPGSFCKTRLEIGIGKNIPEKEHEPFLTNIGTNANVQFWPWADAEISIERKQEENECFRAEMWVNGTSNIGLTTHALRRFMQNVYQPILHSLNQEKGAVNTRYPDSDTNEITHTAERRMSHTFL